MAGEALAEPRLVKAQFGGVTVEGGLGEISLIFVEFLFGLPEFSLSRRALTRFRSPHGVPVDLHQRKLTKDKADAPSVLLQNLPHHRFFIPAGRAFEVAELQ